MNGAIFTRGVMSGDTADFKSGNKPGGQAEGLWGDVSAVLFGPAINAYRNARKRIERDHFKAMTNAARELQKDIESLDRR